MNGKDLDLCRMTARYAAERCHLFESVFYLVSAPEFVVVELTFLVGCKGTRVRVSQTNAMVQ